MPWTAKTFAARHNHSLSPAQAGRAAKQANAMLKRGVPEGEAIATANKRAGASPKSREEHMARRAAQTGQRAAGGEFGVSQSTVSRRMLRDGYESRGRA